MTKDRALEAAWDAALANPHGCTRKLQKTQDGQTVTELVEVPQKPVADRVGGLLTCAGYSTQCANLVAGIFSIRNFGLNRGKGKIVFAPGAFAPAAEGARRKRRARRKSSIQR